MFARCWGEPYGWDYSDPVLAQMVLERIQTFGPVVPELMVRLWSMYGFCGFDGGDVWLCDPAVPVDIPFAVYAHHSWRAQFAGEQWVPVLRDGVGAVLVLGVKSGQQMIISPQRCEVFYSTVDHGFRYVEEDPASQLLNAMTIGPFVEGNFMRSVQVAAPLLGTLSWDTFYSSMRLLVALWKNDDRFLGPDYGEVTGMAVNNFAADINTSSILHGRVK